MASNLSFKPTSDQRQAIEQLRAERDELAARLKDIEAKLAAAKNLFGIAEVDPESLGRDDWSSMAGMIEEIANAAARPLKYEELREKLAELGVAESRLRGNYFYTVLTRLDSQKKIAVKDRKVSKAPNK